jgi:hypothetical protein
MSAGDYLEDVVMRNSLRATKMLSHYGYALLVLVPIALAIPAHPIQRP